jgi:hypothetical protein
LFRPCRVIPAHPCSSARSAPPRTRCSTRAPASATPSPTPCVRAPTEPPCIAGFPRLAHSRAPPRVLAPPGPTPASRWRHSVLAPALPARPASAPTARLCCATTPRLSRPPAHACSAHLRAACLGPPAERPHQRCPRAPCTVTRCASARALPRTGSLLSPEPCLRVRASRASVHPRAPRLGSPARAPSRRLPAHCPSAGLRLPEPSRPSARALHVRARLEPRASSRSPGPPPSAALPQLACLGHRQPAPACCVRKETER